MTADRASLCQSIHLSEAEHQHRPFNRGQFSILLNTTRDSASTPSLSATAMQLDCHLCGSPITQRFYLRLSPNLFVHEQCLRCHECWMPLHRASTCFLRDGEVYCHEDYRRTFFTCAVCGESPSHKDLVRRLSRLLFHASCLRCFVCGVNLGTGDRIHRSPNGGITCSQHASVPVPLPSEPPSPSSSCESSVTMVTSIGLSPTTPSHPSSPQALQYKRSSRSRSRTVLSEAQVHTLRQFYEQNPRPDSYIKEQLASLTGLTTRVIRVWFQNNRCKDKKRRQQVERLAAMEELRVNSLRKEMENGVRLLEIPSVRELQRNDDSKTTGFNDSCSSVSS